MNKTRVIRQRGVPAGVLTEADFEVIEDELGHPQPGEVLVQSLLISVDPYLALRIRAGDFEQHRIRSRLIGRVLESRAPGFSEGDLVLGFGRWQELDILPAQALRLIRPRAPLSCYLGVVGHSGYTALLGTDLLDIQPGQTFSVDSAAGAVGATAGQLAKLAGARVIGIAGAHKADRLVDELGFDSGVDYRRPDFPALLGEAAPAGIDRHFENVGASVLDPVLSVMNRHGRIALCGLISHYEDDAAISLTQFRRLLTQGLRLEGFSIYDHDEGYPAALERLEQLVVDGQLISRETVSTGFDALPAAFLAMLRGEGVGKHMVRIVEGLPA